MNINIFIVNPAAGQGTGDKAFVDIIRDEMSQLELPYEIYETKGVGDATVFVRERIAQAESGGDVLRFIACGGDGTLSEVVNGVIGADNAEVGCIPIGTGNDFVRNFGTPEEFINIPAQAKSPSRITDAIRYEIHTKDEVLRGYGINIINMGFDAKVAKDTSELKKKPFIAGSAAYLAGVATNLAAKGTIDIKVTIGDQIVKEGTALLLAAANGCFYGGGVKGIPKAETNDGMMDISIVDDMKRLEFIKLFPLYAKGTHLETAAGEKYVHYFRDTNVTIEAKNEMCVAIDGEIVESKYLSLEIVPEAIRFVIPDKDL